MWRYNVNTVAFLNFSFERMLELISQNGFKYLELGESHIDIFKMKGGEIRKLSELLDKNGLEVIAFFAEYGLDTVGLTKYSFGHSAPDEKERQRAVKAMREAIPKVADLGCNVIVSEFNGDPSNRERSKRSFLRSMEELIPLLEERNVTMVIEPHPGDFIEDAFQAIDILRSLDSVRIKYNYCIPHTFVLGHSPREIIMKSKGLLQYCHVADSIDPGRIWFCATYTPKVKPHLHLIPGLGDVDFREVLSSLRDTDFDGYLSLDAFSHMKTPVQAMVESRNQIEKFSIIT